MDKMSEHNKLRDAVYLISSEGIKTAISLVTLIHVSPVFEKMFFGQFAEASCDNLELKLYDYKDDDIKAFVKLAGLGSHYQQQLEAGSIMDAVRACAAPAMLLVDKYQAMGLKRLCREALIQKPCFEYIVKYEDIFGEDCNWTNEELFCLIDSTRCVEEGATLMNHKIITNEKELSKLSAATLVKVVKMMNDEVFLSRRLQPSKKMPLPPLTRYEHL